MTTTERPAAPGRTHPRANPPRQLARYGDRKIVGQRIDGLVSLRDEPIGPGESYPIDEGFSCMAEVDALVADYLATADRIGGIPMAGFTL